jgi:hypothetical protein
MAKMICEWEFMCFLRDSNVVRAMSGWAGYTMRGAVTLPGSLGHITCKGIASEAGRSRVRPSASRERDGPYREGEEP